LNKVELAIIVILVILLGFLGFQTFQVQNALNTLKNNYETLKRDHERLQTSYNELQSSYNQLQRDYNELQQRYQQLQGNYSQLKHKYDEYEQYFKPLREARELLKSFASMISSQGLFKYVKDDYQKGNLKQAQYILWYSPNTPYYIDPGYYVFVIERPEYTGEITVSWDIQGSNYYVIVLDMDNFLAFASGEDYYTIDYSFENERRPLYCTLEVGQMYAFVVWNYGSRSIKINDWVIYEKVEVPVDNDLRKVYVANYFVATRVRYVYDIGDEAKPPLTTLSEGGDCEDRAVLLASILLALGYDPSKIALALVDTDGDGIYDHVSCLAQLPSSYDLNYLAYDLAKITMIFTNRDPYADYYQHPNIMLVPSLAVNGSDGYGYFIVLDPPDLTSGEYTALDLIPGNIRFECYNIVYAETLKSLLQS